jgi:cell division ATPase FtsA
MLGGFFYARKELHMHVLRDDASIRRAVTQIPAVAPFISKRIEELSEYADYDLAELVHIIVVEPGDSLAELDEALGFAIEDRAVDAIDVHRGCWELVYVQADDGFGVVVYVPKGADIDPRLLDLCAARAARATP